MFEIHHNNAKRQRKAYNHHRSDKKLLKNTILIEIDFKQNIVIGKH